MSTNSAAGRRSIRPVYICTSPEEFRQFQRLRRQRLNEVKQRQRGLREVTNGDIPKFGSQNLIKSTECCNVVQNGTKEAKEAKNLKNSGSSESSAVNLENSENGTKTSKSVDENLENDTKSFKSVDRNSKSDTKTIESVDQNSENESSTSASAPAPASAPTAAPLKPKKLSWAEMLKTPAQNSAASTATSSPAKPPTPPPITGPIPRIRELGIAFIKYMYTREKRLQTTEIIERGITNTGSICFLNSIIQILVHCEPFYALVNHVRRHSRAPNSGSATPVIDALVDLFEEFQLYNAGGVLAGTEGKAEEKTEEKTEWEGKTETMTETRNGDSHVNSNIPEIKTGPPISVERFYKKLTGHVRFQHLVWGQQEDAEEILGYLFDVLHDEMAECIKSVPEKEKSAIISAIPISVFDNTAEELLNSAFSSELEGGWREVGKKQSKTFTKTSFQVSATPISLLFTGMFKSVLTVPGKREAASITYDPFQHLHLDITDESVKNLEDAFEFLAQPELIDYKLTTGTHVEAEKQSFIDRLPKVFVIHLKRFTFVSEMSSESGEIGKPVKILKKVSYGAEFEIPIKTLSITKRRLLADSANRRYELFGVVYHHGMTTEGGHYTVDVRREGDGRWLRIDDTNISVLGGPPVAERRVEVPEDDFIPAHTRRKGSASLSGVRRGNNGYHEYGDDDDSKTAYILFYRKVE